jgi:hypothetical protein
MLDTIKRNQKIIDLCNQLMEESDTLSIKRYEDGKAEGFKVGVCITLMIIAMLYLFSMKNNMLSFIRN